MTPAAQTSEYIRVNRKFEVAYLPKVLKAIRSKQTEVINHLRSGGIQAAEHFLRNDVGNTELATVVMELYKTVGLRHARMNYSRILAEGGKKDNYAEMEQKGFGFNAIWTKFIEDYLREFLIQKITYEVAKTTRDALLAILVLAYNQGYGIDKTVDMIDNWPGARYQAARVVRTETNRASNVGAKAQSATSQYQQMKQWSSAEDFRVRGNNPEDHADHVGLDGTKINEDDFFVDPRNGDSLDIPGDPKASAESTINCRCRAVFTLKLDASGNPIPKIKTTTVLYPNRPINRREPILV